MGLRIVAKAERKGIYEDCETISDFQYKLAEKLGALEYLDTVCYDYARASFVPQEEDILYIHTQRLFFENPELVLDASKGGPSKFLVPRASAPVAHNGGVPGTLFTEDSSQDSYEGVALDKIFEEYMVLTGGMPEPGGRNSRFYAAARDLRYICDFNPKVIAAHLPQCGLPDAEVYQLCASACMSARGFNIPENVVRAISYAKQILVDAEEPIEADVEADNFEAPILIREFTSRCPEDFRDATLLALLPILGTLATALRARYIDDEVHSPTFYTVVMSEQASGKSFARRLVAELMQSVVAEDATARAVEKEYQAQVKMTKNKDLLPPAPQVKVRIVPPATSLAKLIMRLDQAREEHLFTYCEEMDTLTKSERAGAWFQKSDLYRDGFDNQYYGQDYMSEQSYSAMVRVFYNLLILGTPRQVSRFFSDIENGLVSRVCVATYPDQFVKPMPMFKKSMTKLIFASNRWSRSYAPPRGWWISTSSSPH